MCFSATASFAGAVVVGGLGAATLPLVRERRELAFAALPLGFAVHQAIEGALWTQLDDPGVTAVHGPAVHAWLLFAWVLLPVWVPLAVALAERDDRRRRVQWALLGVGIATAGFLFVQSQLNQVDVTVLGTHLEYRVPWSPAWLPLVPYVVATCGAPITSSHAFIRLFGVTNLVALAVTLEIASQQLSSVWCFFAALISVEILVHYLLEWRQRQEQAALRPAT